MKFSEMKVQVVHGVRSYFYRNWNREQLINSDEIPDEVHRRLKKVYLTLFCAMLSSTFGSYLQWISVAGGQFTVFYCVSSLIWIYLIPPGRVKTRVLLLMLAAYCFGASISAFTNYIFEIEQRYVLRLLAGTTLGSANLLYKAIRTRERIQIYFGCVCYCFVLAIYGIGSILLDSSNLSLLWVISVSHVILFMGYLVIYSQVIIYYASFGDIDVVNCTFTAFFHLPGILIHAARLNLQDAEIEHHQHN